MQGVRFSIHNFFISDDGKEGVIDALYSPEQMTEEQIRQGMEGAQMVVESLLGSPVRPMNDEEIKAYIDRKTREETGQDEMDEDDMPFSVEEEAL